MMQHMLIAVGDHGAAPVPAFASDDVDRGRCECVGSPHHGADVAVVPEVLDGHVERVAARVEVGDDGLARPIPVRINNIAPVTVGQKRRVVPWIGRRLGAVFLGPRALADHRLAPLGGPRLGGGLVLAHSGQADVAQPEQRPVFHTFGRDDGVGSRGAVHHCRHPDNGGAGVA